MGICFSDINMNKNIHYLDVNTHHVLFFLDERWRIGVVRESIKRKHLVIYENDDRVWTTTYLRKKNVIYVGSATWTYYKNAACDMCEQSPPVSPSPSEEEQPQCEG